MYKIRVKIIDTDIQWYEYGFSRYIAKRLFQLMNDTYDTDFRLKYEICAIMKLGKSWKCFKKCLLKEKQYI